MTTLHPIPEPGIFKRCFSRCLDLLNPPVCEFCESGLTHGRSLCENCHGDLPRLTEPFCKTCGEMFPGLIDGPFACPNCHNLSFSFEFARPALERDDRTLDLIHRLKYRREIHLARDLGRLASESFQDPRLAPALEEKWPLIPVPLHYRRLRHRHFNQAEEISLALSKLTGLLVLKALRRNHKTETQTLLSRKERMENLRGAFTVTRHGRKWIGNSSNGAILIDDVLTTGSTVNECAKTLRQSGFKKVVVVTVMRG
ncbi:MAG: ComF family protein [Verrucomicrobiota bacterium]